ncbi:MAG TPA: hypothetical protein VIU12_09620 [Chryseolinea sp.]
MKRILILLLCFVCRSLVSGQTFNREQIIGTWTCREVAFTEPIEQTPDEMATVEKTKRGLIGSQFVFQPNGLFMVHLPVSAPTEFKELESMNNKMWHIKAKERMVFVGSLDDDLMIINIKSANGFYYFHIQDSPLALRMERNR